MMIRHWKLRIYTKFRPRNCVKYAFLCYLIKSHQIITCRLEFVSESNEVQTAFEFLSQTSEVGDQCGTDCH